MNKPDATSITPADFRWMLNQIIGDVQDSCYVDPNSDLSRSALHRHDAWTTAMVNAYAAALARAEAAEATIAATSKMIADRGVCERDCTAPLPDRVDSLIVEQRSAEWWRCKAEMAEAASKPEG